MIHEFQLKWKTYLLLYYAIPSVQQFRSQKKGALCPLSRFQNSISIFLFLFFFFRGMWHICISQLCLIRICWLKVNEINSSWWHWVRLPLCLSTRHTVDPLITCSQSHTFVSTNVHFCCLTVIRYFFFLFLPKRGRSEICPKLSFSLWFTISAMGAFLRLVPGLRVFGMHSSSSSPAAGSES